MTTLQRVIKYCAVAFAIFLIVSIIGGICGAIGVVYSIASGNILGESVVGEMRTYAVSGEINSLDLEVGAAALQIVPGDRFTVESNHKFLTVKETRGTLKISEDRPIFVSAEGVKVVVTVPEGTVFENASIETGAGKVDIETLSADTVSLDLGAGATDIGCLNARSRAEINTGAGKLTISGGELHNLSVDHGVGKLELAGLLSGRCDVDFGVGDADLTLIGSKDDYRIMLDKGIGNATLAGEAMGDGGVFGDGENRIDLNGGIGTIHIRFQAEQD